MIEIQPLSKDIYNKAKSLGVKQIMLAFSGGSDEGYLDITLLPHNNKYKSILTQEIDEWAWGTYNYNGAGDGSDYGDTITYDLEKGEVSADEWYHIVQSEKGGTKKLEIAND